MWRSGGAHVVSAPPPLHLLYTNHHFSSHLHRDLSYTSCPMAENITESNGNEAPDGVDAHEQSRIEAQNALRKEIEVITQSDVCSFDASVNTMH